MPGSGRNTNFSSGILSDCFWGTTKPPGRSPPLIHSHDDPVPYLTCDPNMYPFLPGWLSLSCVVLKRIILFQAPAATGCCRTLNGDPWHGFLLLSGLPELCLCYCQYLLVPQPRFTDCALPWILTLCQTTHPSHQCAGTSIQQILVHLTEKWRKTHFPTALSHAHLLVR